MYAQVLRGTQLAPSLCTVKRTLVQILVGIFFLNGCTLAENEASLADAQGGELQANQAAPMQCILSDNDCEHNLKEVMNFSLNYLYQAHAEMARIGVVHVNVPVGSSGAHNGDTLSYNLAFLPNSAEIGNSLYPLDLPRTLGQEEANLLYRELSAAFSNARGGPPIATNYAFVGCEETDAERNKNNLVHWLTNPLGGGRRPDADSLSQCAYPFDQPTQGSDLSLKFVLALDEKPGAPNVQTVRQMVYVSQNTSGPFRRFGVYQATRPFGDHVNLLVQPSSDENATDPKVLRTVFPVSTAKDGLIGATTTHFREEARALLGMSEPPNDLFDLSNAWADNRMKEGQVAIGKGVALASLAGLGIGEIAPFVNAVSAQGVGATVSPWFARGTVNFLFNAVVETGVVAFAADDVLTLLDAGKNINAIADKRQRALWMNAYVGLKLLSLVSLGKAFENTGKISQITQALNKDIQAVLEGMLSRRWMELHHVKSLTTLPMEKRFALHATVQHLVQWVLAKIGSASTPQQIGEWFTIEANLALLTRHLDEMLRDFDSMRVTIDNPAFAAPPVAPDNGR